MQIGAGRREISSRDFEAVQLTTSGQEQGLETSPKQNGDRPAPELQPQILHLLFL